MDELMFLIINKTSQKQYFKTLGTILSSNRPDWLSDEQRRQLNDMDNQVSTMYVQASDELEMLKKRLKQACLTNP